MANHHRAYLTILFSQMQIQMKSFASDNYSGAVPEVMDALIQANVAHEKAYGDDPYTQKLKAELQGLLGMEIELHLVFNGTGANIFGLSCMVDTYSAILCAETAHIYNDESTAPEAYLGCRLRPLKVNTDGKLLPEVVEQAVFRQGDFHFAQPRVLSITQSTECGTVYTLDELRALKKAADSQGLLLHLDGSRLLVAAAALGCSLGELVAASGADVISLGGTKLGMLYGEAVIITNPSLWGNSKFLHKRSMQLSSKNRFIAAQFLALLENEVWRKYALQAIGATQKLKAVLDQFPQVSITKTVEANAIFATLPTEWIAPLQEEAPFYVWDEQLNEVRLMCAFDTDQEEIRRFEKQLHVLSKSVSMNMA